MSFELYKKEGLVEAVSFGSLFRKSPTIFSLYDETVTKQGVREREKKSMYVC